MAKFRVGVTGDLRNAHGQPAFLTQLNTLTPTDLAGNASGIDVDTDLTLDSGETLDSWNFDGTGTAAGASQRFMWMP